MSYWYRDTKIFVLWFDKETLIDCRVALIKSTASQRWRSRNFFLLIFLLTPKLNKHSIFAYYPKYNINLNTNLNYHQSKQKPKQKGKNTASTNTNNHTVHKCKHKLNPDVRPRPHVPHPHLRGSTALAECSLWWHLSSFRLGQTNPGIPGGREGFIWIYGEGWVFRSKGIRWKKGILILKGKFLSK